MAHNKLPMLSQPQAGCAHALRRCTRCGLPETYETIEFDGQGICNVCNQRQVKVETIDWATRKTELHTLVNQYRGKYAYDCLVPFSGGKDSTFTLHYLVKELKLKPLVVQFNHGFMRPTLLKNNERTLKQLGVESLTFTPNWHLVRRLMLEALIRKGDFCWHCHTGIFAYPMQLALRFQVPLIMWGEPSSEYTAYYSYDEHDLEEVDETRFNRYVNLGITAEDMEGMIKSDFAFDPRDLAPFAYPPRRELKKLGCRSVCLGSYIPWDAKSQSQFIGTELGWAGDQVEGMPWDVYPYEKIECSMQGVRDYIKFLKRGYSRVSQMTALDRRNDRMSKEEGDRLVREFEGHKPASLKLFLDYLSITEQQFTDIVRATVVAPHEPLFDQIPDAPKTWDYDLWYRENQPLVRTPQVEVPASATPPGPVR